MAAVRSYFVGEGLCEVTTPVRLPAVALEPYIEPLPCGDGFLATSPELPMKQLLCRGSGPIFQIAPVFRRGEVGDRHREEFRLVEWYRLDPDPAAVRADVVGLVAAVTEAVADLAEAPRDSVSWQTVTWLEVLAETTGLRLRGDETSDELRDAVRTSLPELWHEAPEMPRLTSERSRTLLAWTSLFTGWSDAHLDPWLAQRHGVHLVDFPGPLAALSRCDGSTSARFESHVAGLELANGYGELTDAAEQAARFEAVTDLRRAQGLPALPRPQSFLDDLEDPGLPPCSGAALGLDRLVMWATGAPRLDPL
jgi:lysyl-tRNA synthetase class 2